MLLLANENFPGLAVEALRSKGHDLLWVRTEAPGIPNAEVLARAQAEHRLLITFDKDFGELAFRSRLPAECGVILLRIPARSPKYVAQMVAKVLDARVAWAGTFSVVEEDRSRSVPLPAARS